MVGEIFRTSIAGDDQGKLVGGHAGVNLAHELAEVGIEPGDECGALAGGDGPGFVGIRGIGRHGIISAAKFGGPGNGEIEDKEKGRQ